MIDIQELTFRYTAADKPAIAEISLLVNQGEFVLISGPSGSGKSTLLRCLNGLVPHFSGGIISGLIQVDGSNVTALGPRVMASKIGFVFQSPESQAVLDVVEDEIAFSLENAGIDQRVMHNSVSSILEEMGIAGLRRRPLRTLSSGERQKVAIATALVMNPKILVLDEPSSQLDPVAAENIFKLLRNINIERKLSVILVEQRIDSVRQYADRLLYLADGKLLFDCSIAESQKELENVLPFNEIRELKPRSEKLHPELPATMLNTSIDKKNGSSPQHHSLHREDLLVVSGLHFEYRNRSVLKGINLSIQQGEAVAVHGNNGSGKSTLLRTLVGLLRPRVGEIWHRGRNSSEMSVAEICQNVAYLPQVPDDLLFADTVQEELDITLMNHGLDPSGYSDLSHQLLTQFGLIDFSSTYPRDLSVGQRQRLAMAALMITKPAVILMDEPTRGLDLRLKLQLIRLWEGWLEAGIGILLVTHDKWLAKMIADRVLFLNDGILTEMPGIEPEDSAREPSSQVPIYQ